MTWSDLAAAQDGLVSRRQLLQELTPAAVRHLLDSGRLEPMCRGVYGAVGSPATVWRSLRAALLAAGDAVASHRAAAALHRFPGVLPGAAEITVFARRAARLPNVTVHSASTLFTDDVTRVDTFPCTTAARTLVDLAQHPMLARMLDHCLDRRLCTVDDIEACLDRLGRGPRQLRVLLADRREGDSPLERKWLLRLRKAGVPEPVVGYQLVIGNRVLVLDMAWPRRRVAVEVDGWSAHRTRGRFDRDRERDLYAARAGWRLLHVTSRTPLDELLGTLLPLLGHKVS